MPVKYRKGKCSCTFWVDGYFDGQKIRKALKTRNQQKALDDVRNWRSLDSLKRICKVRGAKTRLR
jgi:hypothetical protein